MDSLLGLLATPTRDASPTELMKARFYFSSTSYGLTEEADVHPAKKSDSSLKPVRRMHCSGRCLQGRASIPSLFAVMLVTMSFGSIGLRFSLLRSIGLRIALLRSIEYLIARMLTDVFGHDVLHLAHRGHIVVSL